jgi:hypothetical protein
MKTLHSPWCLVVALLWLCTTASDLNGQGYFRFQAGDGPTRVGSADGPLAGSNVVSQILAGVDGITLTPVGVPMQNYMGIIPVRNIVEVPFLNPQDAAFVRFAAWDESIWGMNYKKVPSDAVGISSLATVFLHQKDDESYIIPRFQGAVIVPQSVPEPGCVAFAAIGLGILWVCVGSSGRSNSNR